ncbi:autoinducer binding domain-containing protein, partial [Acinetobacter baumannii]
MLTHFHLNTLLKTFKAARNEDELKEALAHATRMLGFAQFAMGHHVDLAHPPLGALRLSTYNDDWVSHVMERGYFAED